MFRRRGGDLRARITAGDTVLPVAVPCIISG